MGVRSFGSVQATVLSLFLACCTLGAASSPASAAAPTIEAESFTNVGSSSATVSAKIDAGGSLTSYQFEYGTSEAYGATTPVTSAGSASEGVGVTASLEGLKTETVYHFRVVATNAGGEVASGSDASFTTLPVGLLGLPDNRGYELVSPVNNADGNVYEPQLRYGGISFNGDSTNLPFQAAVDGNAITYAGDPSATGGNGSEGTSNGNQYLSARRPEGGWTSRNIDPPSASIAETASYEAFSPDLSLGILNYRGASPLAPGAPANKYHVLYSVTDSGGDFHPLFLTTPPNRGREAFKSYEAAGHGEKPLVFAGASSNYEHLLFEANDVLTSTPGATDGGEEANNLYDSVNGQLYLINVLPDGTTEPGASFGGQWVSEFGSTGGQGNENSDAFDHDISANGTRIFWSTVTGEGAPRALYMRENDTSPTASTVEIDVSHGAGASGGGRFWTASADGSKVFFTDESQLTGDSTASSGAPDLYEYDVASGHLTDLAVDGHPGEHANVLGVVGASEDGSYLYFVASGALAPDATPQTCARGEAQSLCNLYVVHDGSTRLIAALSRQDDDASGGNGAGAFGAWEPGLGNRTAQVTPDGTHLAFMSQANLTGYEADGHFEVYLYDAAGAGRLVCTSCNPSGQVASGPRGTSNAQVTPSFSNTYIRRWLSEDGSRVFFNSTEALVPQDTNGLSDVYEWERDGAGSCTRSEGCIYLLSGGTSSDNSQFADASPNGNDVFVVTRAELVHENLGGTFALYDARVGTAERISPPSCTGSGCQGLPLAPPIFATPSSVTFNGVGNFPGSSGASVKTQPKTLPRSQRLANALRACRRVKPKNRRLSCEARAKKRYGTKTQASRLAKGRK